MMKNDLTCGVVRDLLPSYVEGLTSQETNQAVEAHLASCPACTACRDAMKAPTEPAEATEQDREVDYLKTVKRKSGRRAMIAVLCTVLLLAAGLAAKIFIIGSPAQEQELFVADVQEENGVLRLSVSTPASATAYWGWTVDTADGVADIHARSVLVSPLFPNGGGTVEVPLEGIREIRLCGRIVWQDGTIIQERVARLYETKTSYVGDISALNRIANTLNIQSQFGGYTNSLQTSHEPYGWTLEFTSTYTEENAAKLDKLMTNKLAPLMLSLVDNLDQVSWTYPVVMDSLLYTETRTRTVTTESASVQWAEGGSIKECAASPASFQKLCDRLMG